MKRIDTIKRASRNLSQSKGRTILTSMAIAVGAFAIMTSMALGTGTKEYMAGLIGTNINERTIQVNKDKMQASFDGMGGSGLKEYSETRSEFGREQFSIAEIDKIKQVDGVKKIFPYQMLNLRYFTIEGNAKKWSSSVSPYDPLIENKALTGAIPMRGSDIKDDEVVVPEKYLEKIGVNATDAIGKKVVLHIGVPMTEENIKAANINIEQMADPVKATEVAKNLEKTYEFTVVGILKDTPLAMTGASLAINEATYSKIGDAVVRGTPDYQKYYAAIVEVKDGIAPETVKANIEKETKFSVMTARDLQSMMFQFVNILQAIVVGFGVLALIVSIFGIINTMYVSVVERTSQIGLMKALGMRSKHVSRLFRYEAAWIGLIGSVLGVGLSWLIGTLMNPWISKTVGFKDGSIYLLKYDIWQALILVAILILIAIIAGWFPSRKAAKLDPIEALRTE